MRIILVDMNKDIVNALSEVFKNDLEVDVYEGDYFDFPADAIVSPANSNIIMDGGLDEAIRAELGHQVESYLWDKTGGWINVGEYSIIEIDHHNWEYLISAPTMEAPGDVSGTNNAYLSFKAVLEGAETLGIQSVLCCGMGAGVGNMDPYECGRQMKEAYDEFVDNYS